MVGGSDMSFSCTLYRIYFITTNHRAAAEAASFQFRISLFVARASLAYRCVYSFPFRKLVSNQNISLSWRIYQFLMLIG